MHTQGICPTCNRKMPVTKGTDKKLTQDLAKAHAAIRSLELWQHWPGDGPNQKIAMESAIACERTRLNQALTDPKLLWSIYRRSQKGGYNTMEHLSTTETSSLMGVAAGEQADMEESRNVAIASGEITEREQADISRLIAPPPFHDIGGPVTIPDYPGVKLVTHVCLVDPTTGTRETVSMDELREKLSWCSTPEFYISRLTAGEKVVTDSTVYEPVLADPISTTTTIPTPTATSAADPWLRDDSRQPSAESW